MSARLPGTTPGVAAGGRRPRGACVALLPARGDGERGVAAAATERWRTLARSTVARTEVAAARIGDHAYVGGPTPGLDYSDVAEALRVAR
jgi:hypothetical protein